MVNDNCSFSLAQDPQPMIYDLKLFQSRYYNTIHYTQHNQ